MGQHLTMADLSEASRRWGFAWNPEQFRQIQASLFAEDQFNRIDRGTLWRIHAEMQCGRVILQELNNREIRRDEARAAERIAAAKAESHLRLAILPHAVADWCRADTEGLLAMPSDAASPEEFLYSLSIRARKVCRRLNCKYPGDLTKVTEGQLRRERNCGDMTIDEISRALAKYGLAIGSAA